MTESARPRVRTVRSNIVFAFAVALALYLAWLLRRELLLIYVSALFAVVLEPLVSFISNLRIGHWRPFRRVGILVLLLAIAGSLGAFVSLAVPPVVNDLRVFAQEMPVKLPKMMDALMRTPVGSRIDVPALTSRVRDSLTDSVAYVLRSAQSWAGALVNIAMGFILTVYFSLEGETVYRWVLSFFPHGHRERLDGTLRRAEVRMQRWLIGQGSLMLILGLASTATYMALNLRYAYALGFLTGLLNIIPVVGAAVCIVLALLVAAIDSWGRVLGVAIFYIVYFNLENSFLTPRIMKSSVGLPGLAILAGLLIGSALAGIVGALVSVPTTVLVSVLLDEYLAAKEA